MRVPPVILTCLFAVAVLTGCASAAKTSGASAAPSSAPAGVTGTSGATGATGATAAGGALAGPPVPGVTAAAAAVAGVSEKAPIDLATKPVMTVSPTGTPTTLQIADIVTGSGPAATPTSTVTVQYLGLNYADGSEFNSTWRDNGGKPTPFSLTQVVPGFTQGIGGSATVPPMKVGGRRIIIVPSALGYGAQGSPPAVAANENLIFVVDLLSIS
jgi:peptidylprolyl isomerase